MIRPMQIHDEPKVRALYQGVHWDWEPRPKYHFWAYPTLVAVEDERVVGFTGYVVHPVEGGKICLSGYDVVVDPEYRGRGIGLDLCEKRLEIARDIGAHLHMGACKPENAAMRRVFEKLGLRPVPGTWSDGQIYFAVHLDDAYLSENF